MTPLAGALFAVGCATQYHMGEAIQPAKPLTSQAAATSSQAASKLAKQTNEWDTKWQQIQGPNDTIDWADHARVCTIKFRYRNYDALLRCLDLFEAKVAKAKSISNVEEARQVAPVFLGWMRASAYSELGEPAIALKWADSAWIAVPREYQEASSHLTSSILPLEKDAKRYRDGAMRLGGSSKPSGDAAEGSVRWGRDNPAGLDMSPEMLTMSIEAQRAMLYAHLGQRDRAQAALDDLKRWEHLHKHALGIIPMGDFDIYTREWLTSLGPLYALGKYAQVIQVYERDARLVARDQQISKIGNTLNWVAFAPIMVIGKSLDKAYDAAFTAPDIRLFTIATEDAANALLYAQSLMQLGKVSQARGMYDKLLALPEIRAMGNLYWVVLYERGLIAIGDGKSSDALRLFSQAVDAIESVRNTLSLEAAKIGFAGDKQAVYGALVRLLAGSGDWNGAFIIAERAKARALVDLLAQQRDLPAPIAANENVRTLFAHAQTSETSIGYPSTEAQLRGIALIADARAALVDAAPEAASLVSVQKVSAAQVAAHLEDGETLIDYYASGEDLYAFVLNSAVLSGFKLSARNMDADVRAYRDSIARGDANITARGGALYARLIQPLQGAITSNKLTISPHGVLHYLPFGALPGADGQLIDKFSIRYIPSAAALGYVKARPTAKAGKLLALGNPDLGNPRFDLPNAQIEALSIAAMFPDSRALVGAQASKSAVKELASGFSMLHFATHGKFDSTFPLSSGLYLAKGSETDGVLTVSDLYSLRWDVDLVTLSACETGIGQIANGDDVLGLVRGFLYAGSRSIVASLWEVDDKATEQLMVSFYRNLGSHDRREALRLAQIETRAQYSHPRFWAAFELTGSD